MNTTEKAHHMIPKASVLFLSGMPQPSFDDVGMVVLVIAGIIGAGVGLVILHRHIVQSIRSDVIEGTREVVRDEVRTANDDTWKHFQPLLEQYIETLCKAYESIGEIRSRAKSLEQDVKDLRSRMDESKKN